MRAIKNLSSAGQHPASPEHPCHPQGGTLEPPECPPTSHPSKMPPSPPQEPLTMPRDFSGQGLPLPQGARPCKIGQHGHHTWPQVSRALTWGNPGALTSLPRGYGVASTHLWPPSSFVSSLFTNKKPGSVPRRLACPDFPVGGPTKYILYRGTMVETRSWGNTVGDTPAVSSAIFQSASGALCGKVQDPKLGIQEQSSRRATTPINPGKNHA